MSNIFFHLVDCQWTEWEGWSPCSKSCGDGIRERQRNVSREALNGGDSCQGAAAAFEECNDGPCLDALTPEKLQTEVDNLRTELKVGCGVGNNVMLFASHQSHILSLYSIFDLKCGFNPVFLTPSFIHI